MKKTIVIGTRGSRLAMTQTGHVAEQLRAVAPDCDVRIEVISTKGDRVLDRPLVAVDGKGLFTKEIEVALLEGRIDLAVHSMKDLPTDLPEGLMVGAVPPRVNPHDALVTQSGAGLADLPAGATVGTSSLRRRAQLRACRSDLEVVDLRGNVDTRLRRVAEGDLDAAVLACAGLERLGRADAITEVLSAETMLPAPGQGALAIEIRADDAATGDIVARIADAGAAAEVAAERALLAALGGGCRVPIGALARADGDTLSLEACVCSPDGATVLRTAATGTVSEAAALGEQAAEVLLAEGAGAIVASVIELLGEEGRLPLAGKRVVVTRGRTQAGELVGHLERLGAEVFAFPTIEIQAPADAAPLNPARFDWLVLTSANAATMFVELTARQGHNPNDVAGQVAVVGPATGEATRANGLGVDLMAERHIAEGLLESLAAREPDLAGKRVLVPRSDIARSFLPDELRRQGADVTEWVVYRTVCPDVGEDALAALMGFAPDVVTFTSSSTARNFGHLLGAERLEAMKGTTAWASIGPATTKTARELGLDVTIEPADHTVAGLVEALSAALRG